MLHKIVNLSSLYVILDEIDAKITAKVQATGCPICGSPLHMSRYPRKPRGIPTAIHRKRWWRLSLCCSQRDCRKRVTPPSVTFLGRKWYPGCIVVAVCSGLQGQAGIAMPITRMIELFSVSWKTVKRWRQWWSKWVPKTALWRSLQGRFAKPIDTLQLPRSLLERIVGTAQEQLLSLLRLVGPLTTESVTWEKSTVFCGG